MWSGLAHKIESHLLSFDTVVILATWIFSLAGAAFTYAVQSEAANKSVRGFVRYCVPKGILHNRSCRLDVIFVGLAALIPSVLMVPFMVSSVAVSVLGYHGLSILFGPRPQMPESTWMWIVLLLGMAIVQDFMVFLAHYLQHRWASLWELHKVHHSAEFLIPLTNRRFHPLQAIVDNFFTMTAVGIFVAVTSYAFALPIKINSIAGMDALFVINMLSFYHLRHSHIPMRYGWLERHLMSPAQHQLHHSREERHWDKNFGLCFSWWDRACGTLIYSSPTDTFTQGLPLDIQHEYDHPLGLFWVPVRNLGRMAWRGLRPSVPNQSASGSAIGASASASAGDWHNLSDLKPAP